MVQRLWDCDPPEVKLPCCCCHRKKPCPIFKTPLLVAKINNPLTSKNANLYYICSWWYVSWFVANVTPFWKFEFGLINSSCPQVDFVATMEKLPDARCPSFCMQQHNWPSKGVKNCLRSSWSHPPENCGMFSISPQQGGFLEDILAFFCWRVLQKVSLLDSKIVFFFFASSAFVVASPGTSGSGKAIFRRGIWRSASMLRPRCVSWGVTKPWWYTRQKLTAGYPKNWWGSLEKASLAENMSMFWYLCQISEGYFAVYRGWLYYPVIYIRDHNEPLLGSLLTKQIMECHRGFERCSIWGLPKPCDSGWSIHFYEGAPLLTFTINWYSV